MSTPGHRPLATLFCAPLLAVGFAACASTSTTAGFKGEAHAVAQTISNLQADASGRDEQKICADDLASSVVRRLESAKGGCKQALKNQLEEVDNFELTVEEVHLSGSAAHPTASASVRNLNSGKTRLSTISLVKEAGRWKVSSIP